MQSCTLKIHFTKTGTIKYISHLDLLRLFRRASRRAGLPLALTEGFNPHAKLKIEPALKLGTESNDLEAEIVLSENISPARAKERLEKELPGGIKIIAVDTKA